MNHARVAGHVRTYVHTYVCMHLEIRTYVVDGTDYLMQSASARERQEEEIGTACFPSVTCLSPFPLLPCPVCG